jgi:hypothetical protein
MLNLKGESETKPEEIIIGKHYVDVNLNVKKITKKAKGENTSKTVFAFDIARYTIEEYLKHVTEVANTASAAVAEISDLVLTKEA